MKANDLIITELKIPAQAFLAPYLIAPLPPCLALLARLYVDTCGGLAEPETQN